MLASKESSGKENFKNSNSETTKPPVNRSTSFNGNHAKLRSNGSSSNLNDTLIVQEDAAQSQETDSVPDTTNLYDEFDGLVYKDLNNASQTLKMLNVLRKNRQLCDLILQLDDDSQDIYCHQVILACNSKFFMEIFNNYESEEKKESKSNNTSSSSVVASDSASSTSNLSKQSSEEALNVPTPTSNHKKHSLQAIVNKNHNTSHRQLLLCLSDYLRNYLSDSHHHHHAKLNNVVNHNSHYHHHHYHHMNSTNHHSIDQKISSVSHHDSTSHHHQINHNLDFEALKLCIDYMYTSKLRVPSYLLPHVYTLAYHLSIDRVVEACASYLTKHLNVDNCLSIRSFALDENLIQTATQCIEKNIEYILRLGPNRSISSSNSSLFTSQQSDPGDLTNLTDTLSSSLNLANKEFNNLPRINIELVGLKPNKYRLPECTVYLTELCMNWLVNELVNEKQNNESQNNLTDLCGHLNMLYMNVTDQTLHDCCDMDSSDCNYSDYINDYQKHHSLNYKTNSNGTNSLMTSHLKQNGSQSQLPVSIQNSRSPSPFSNSSNRLKTFKITDQELNAIGTATPIKVKVLHDNEVVCTHQTSENSFITICTLTGKLVTLSVHLLPIQPQSNNNDEINIDNLNNISNNSENKNFTANSHESSNGHVESQFSLDQQNNRADIPQNSVNNLNQSAILNETKSGSINPSFNSANNIMTTSMSNTLDFEKLPKMSVARCSHGVIAYDNKLFIIGGYDRGECLDVCEVYDPATNTIERIESMVNRRGRAAITWFQKENSIYAMGGSDGHEDLNSIECYSLEKRTWTSIKFDFELSCSNLGTISCSNFIYLVGLKGDGGKSLSRSSCLKYNPTENTFIRMGELIHGRSQSALVIVPFKSRSANNSNEMIDKLSPAESCNSFHLYVFGGHDQIRCLSTCEIYDPKEDKWSLITGMHESRRGCGAAYHSYSHSIYIVGGTNGSQSLKSVEIYNTLTKRWSMGPDLNIARTNVAIAFIGNILFAVGGFNGKSFLRTIEYLDCNDLNIGWSMYHKPANFDFFKNNSE